MSDYTITKDESLLSTFKYGDVDFPFDCYIDDLDKFKGKCIDWHWHTEFEFVYIENGQIKCEVGTEQIILKKGNGIFINSGSIHRFTSSNGGKMISVLFSTEFIAPKNTRIYQTYIYPYINNTLEYYILNNHCDLPEIIKSIGMQKQSNGAFDELNILCVISDLWQKFYKQTITLLNKNISLHQRIEKSRLHKMLNYIYQNYSSNISLDNISTSANISKSEALRCFQNILATTPINFLNECRIVQAAHQLESTSKTVTAIAFDVGYSNSGYFGKAFRKRFGCTPNEYRKDIDKDFR